MSSETLAVIDLGSASSRLLISSKSDSVRYQSIRYQSVTRMADGLETNGIIGPAAMARVKDVLAGYETHCRSAKVSRIDVVATATARKAKNRSELAALVSEELGAELRVLSEEEEGELAFIGATAQLADDTLALVIDIGGGSSEFIVGVAGQKPGGVASVPMGAVNFTEAYLESDPPDPAELSSALSVAATYVDDVVRILPTVPNAVAHGTVVGVGGTATTAAAVELGLAEYKADQINGFVLSREAAEDVFRTLATEAHSDRAFNPGLEAARVPLIVGGLCVLLAVMRQLRIDEIVVSDDDLLEAAVGDMRTNPNVGARFG